jgi:hypothetical protein
MFRIRTAARALPACLILFAAGCGGAARPPVYSVDGTLTYTDGTPVPGGASVTFHTESGGKAYQARGAVGPDGRFRLTTFDADDGAVAGEHKVSVAAIPGGEERPAPTVPPQYASTETSGLTVTVQSGSNAPVIKIERPKGKK